jgi:glycerate 2-kinase
MKFYPSHSLRLPLDQKTPMRHLLLWNSKFLGVPSWAFDFAVQLSRTVRGVRCSAAGKLNFLVGIRQLRLASGMKVLVVPDKFKGTLTARQAAEAIASGWRSFRPEDELQLLPMSDGGDGFNEVLSELTGAVQVTSSVSNAAKEPVTAAWGWSENEHLAIIETAQANGLVLLPPGKFHPFDLDTYGVGELILAAHRQGAKSCIAGIGGSATNDAGFGMARALGYRFLGAAGGVITTWVELPRLREILPPPIPARFEQFVIACDVQNPLLGEQGATRIYGPQKGMRSEDFKVADEAFEALVNAVKRDLGLDAAAEAGTGAAGGLGYGLRVFLGGKFEPGFSIFERYSKLEERISWADLVITAEGAIDEQSQMGKGTGAVAQTCARMEKRCVGLAGYLPHRIGAPFAFTWGMFPDLTTVAEAKGRAAYWLEQLAQKAAREIAVK